MIGIRITVSTEYVITTRERKRKTCVLTRIFTGTRLRQNLQSTFLQMHSLCLPTVASGFIVVILMYSLFRLNSVFRFVSTNLYVNTIFNYG